MNQNPSTTHFDELGRIRLAGYPAGKPFANFLPGIAGLFGIPVWVFTVNRGQCIASFGVKSKDNPIVEFQPANKAYQLTPLHGFRTFLRIEGIDEVVEPFSASRPAEPQTMWIGMGELEIQDQDTAAGWQVTVNYTGLMNEPFGALIRQVTLRNLSAATMQVSLLDGLPAVQPFGVNNWVLKEIGRTLEAWMEVYNVSEGMPFYRLRASVADSEKVERYSAGHFYLPLPPSSGAAGNPAIIIDPRAIFGADTTFLQPQVFAAGGLEAVLAAPQVGIGRTPCAFSGLSLVLGPGEQVTLASAFGHAADQADLPAVRACLAAPGFLAGKLAESRAFFTDLTNRIETHTAHSLFDAHLRQAYLDNLVRGGLPRVYGPPGERKVFHLYSRKHGDLERDYNAFQVNPEMFSQGNANYRDVNQNRRCDVFFDPAVEDTNILTFLNLIQLDGYNPLVLTGVKLAIPPTALGSLLALSPTPEKLQPLLEGSFTPGGLLAGIRQEGVQLNTDLETFIEQVMRCASFEPEAQFHEGFWIDHWTYNLDLIDAFLAVYPERKARLFFEHQLTWYESPVSVQPRRRKYTLTAEGVRQYGAVQADEEKAARIAARTTQPNQARDLNGNVIYSTVFAKLAALAVIKFATLDPSGIGIEMEAGRPGWYDALNGLPGVLGSSLNETHALARLLRLLREVLPLGGAEIALPVEQMDLVRGLQSALYDWRSGGEERDFRFWEACATAREDYRACTRFGLDGCVTIISMRELDGILRAFETKVRAGLEAGSRLPLPDGQDLPPTYLVHTLEEWDDGAVFNGGTGIHAKKFAVRALPPFLEGVVNAMRSSTPGEAPALHERLLHSTLYDAALGMLRVNASLAGEPQAIGRVRAFPPGWLENESIWTHMSYKYLLELLRKDLHAAFFEAMPKQMAPFLDPAVYGRSPLELSSFIASSAHPDPSLHGAGFVARLSGATAEMLSIWWEMFTGGQPFRSQEGQLTLALRPILPAWLFDAQNTAAFRFLGSTLVTYHNPARLDLFGTERPAPKAYRLTLADGREVDLSGPVIFAPYAAQVRNGEVKAIRVTI